MKTIVFLSDGTKHSAWDDKKQARYQISVLADYGYTGAYFQVIDHNYENGHYFI